MNEKSIEYSHERCIESAKRQIEIGLKTLNLVYLTHAGALVAILGFLAHRQDLKLSANFYWAGWCFVAGLVLIILASAFGYFQQVKLTILENSRFNYDKTSLDYSNGLIIYEKMKEGKVDPEILEKNRRYLIEIKEYLDRKNEEIKKPFSNCLLYISILFGFFSLVTFIIGVCFVLSTFEDQNDLRVFTKMELPHLNRAA